MLKPLIQSMIWKHHSRNVLRCILPIPLCVSSKTNVLTFKSHVTARGWRWLFIIAPSAKIYWKYLLTLLKAQSPCPQARLSVAGSIWEENQRGLEKKKESSQDSKPRLPTFPLPVRAFPFLQQPTSHSTGVVLGVSAWLPSPTAH